MQIGQLFEEIDGYLLNFVPDSYWRMRPTSMTIENDRSGSVLSSDLRKTVLKSKSRRMNRDFDVLYNRELHRIGALRIRPE